MASQKKMNLCPVLAKEYNIITIANMNSLQLSTYSRLPGTRVKISCLSNTFKVLGPTWLTCGGNGSWDKPIPRCVSRKEFEAELSRRSTTANPNKVTKTELPSTLNSDSSTAIFTGTITPYVITVCVLAIMFLSLVFILTYLVRMRRIINKKVDEIEEKDRRPAHVRAVDSLRSLQSGSTTVYDYFRQSNSPTLSASASSNSSDQRFKRTTEQERSGASYFNSVDQRFKREGDPDRPDGIYSHYDPRYKRARSQEMLHKAHTNSFDQRFKRERDRDTRSLQYTIADDRWLAY